MPDENKFFDGYPLPIEHAKGGAAALKFFIASGAIAEMVFSVITCVKNQKDTPSLLFDSLTLGATLYDFSLSCAFGYGLYSPMDASSSKIAGTTYANAIQKTSDACSHYSSMWLVKTGILALSGVIPIAMTLAKRDAAKKVSPEGGAEGPNSGFEQASKYINRAIGVVNIIAAGVSLILEFIAIGHFGVIPKDKLDKKEDETGAVVDAPKGQYQDWQVFLSDTIGFICVDFRTIIDNGLLFSGTKNVYVLAIAMTIREAFALTYVASQYASFTIIVGASSSYNDSDKK